MVPTLTSRLKRQNKEELYTRAMLKIVPRDGNFLEEAV